MSTTETTNGKKDDKSAPVTSTSNETIIDILLLSGSRKRFNFDISMTVSEVLAYIYKEWPTAWTEAKPPSLKQLRLLHRGQFLADSTTLELHKIEVREVTVMHLNIRPSDTVDSKAAKKPDKPPEKIDNDSHGSEGCCSSCLVS